jgi:hypothetical protein
MLSRQRSQLKIENFRSFWEPEICLGGSYISVLWSTLIWKKVFEFPLTPVPLSLANLDGTMNKTDKSKLMHKLESLVEKPANPKPESITITLVDAMFLLHTLNPAVTFGGIAWQLLRYLCSMSKRVDLVCDTYTEDIKDLERTRRGAVETEYQITGPEQTRPKEWSETLKSASFKTAFFRFLLVEWKDDRYGELLSGHEVYVGVEDQCVKFASHGGRVLCEDVPCYINQHIEADTRIIFHLVQILKEDEESTVSIRANDTDILVLLLYHASLNKARNEIYMDVGLDSKSTRRYIDISHKLKANKRP